MSNCIVFQFSVSATLRLVKYLLAPENPIYWSQKPAGIYHHFDTSLFYINESKVNLLDNMASLENLVFNNAFITVFSK